MNSIDLSLLTDNPSKFLYIVPNVLSDQECNDLIHLSSDKYEPRFKDQPDLAWNHDRWVCNDPLIATRLFDQLCIAFPDLKHKHEAQALNPFLRFLRYHAGQRFAPHVDGQTELQIEGVDMISNFTVQFYLNDDYQGGETTFIEELPVKGRDKHKIPIKGQKGRAVIFTQDLLHEGSTVSEGTKYTLRTDLMSMQPK